MKKKTLLVLICLFPFLWIFGYSEGGESIPSEVISEDGNIARSGKEKIRSLIDQASQFDALKQMPKELECLEEALNLLKDYPDEALESEVYAYLASTYLNLDNPFLSLEYAEKSRLIAERLGDEELICMGLLNLGNVTLKLRKYEDAIHSYQLALEHASKLNNERRLTACFNNLAICYWRLKNWTLCEKYLRLAKEKLVEGSAHYFLVHSNLGLILVEQERYAEGEKYLLEALEFNREKESDFSQALNLSNLADLEVRRGNIEKAIDYCMESLSIAEKINGTYLFARTHRHMGRACVALKEMEKAEFHLQESLKYAQKMEDKAEELETLSVLFDLYRDLERYKEALAVQIEMNRYQSEILNIHSRVESILFNVRYETEKKERQIEFLLKEKELSQLKASEQELQMQSAESELKIAEQRQIFHVKLRNFMIITLTGFAIGILVLIVLFLAERRLRKRMFEQKKLLDEANLNLKETNKSLTSINQEKDEILSIVAHDLRNPLSVQIGLGQLLCDGIEEMKQEEVSEYVKDILNSSTRMGEIITHLLNANKLEQGSIRPVFKQFDVVELLREATKSIQYQISEKHQILIFESEELKFEIESDRSLLLQVVDNLLSNAIKYSPAFKRIWIGVERMENGLKIFVKDEGPGVLAEEQNLLFEKYKTTSNKPTAGESSIGLGLGIAKQLVEMMNGRVWYEDSLEGGSQFCIFLPLKSSTEH